MTRIGVIAVVLAYGLGVGCSSDGAGGGAGPKLPAGEAGEVVARAVEAAGGWQRWQALRDAAYVATLTVLDPFGNVTSQSIGWFAVPLHAGLRARMDSIGNASEAQLGVDGDDTWVLREGELSDDPARLELTRFTLVGNFFWFALPFSLAELPATVTDLGEQTGEQGERWRRLKFVFDVPGSTLPGEWFVFYFDARTGLIDRVLLRTTASFLRHEIWLGKWLDYRDWAGVKKERQRKFFPADLEGSIVGNLVAEHLVEYVRFDNGFPPEHFDRPGAAGARVALRKAETPQS